MGKPSIGDFRSAKVLGTFVFHWQQAHLAAAGRFKSLLCPRACACTYTCKCVCVRGLPPSIRTEMKAMINFSCEPFCHTQTQRTYKFAAHQWTTNSAAHLFYIYAGNTTRSDTVKTRLCQHRLSLYSAHHAASCARAISLIIVDC